MKFKILLLALMSAAFISACDKKDTPAPTPSANTQQTSQPAAPAAPAAQPAAPAAPAAAADSTGVAECDKYLEVVKTCYETKAPEATRGAMMDGLNQMKAGWAAVPADGKAALADSCKQALEAVKPSLQAMGCTM